MHVAHTARLETFDIFSQAARMGCISLLHRPLAFSGGGPGEAVIKMSKSENDEEVRLMAGIEEREDFMDKGELGGFSELVSGDCGVGLSVPSPSHKLGAERCFR